jgi:hypothetical protein
MRNMQSSRDYCLGNVKNMDDYLVDDVVMVGTIANYLKAMSLAMKSIK